MRLVAVLFLGLLGWSVIYMSQPANLAHSFRYGFLLPRDTKAALKWYIRAAEEGDIDAARDVAYLYAPAGKGPQDYANALKWLRFAAGRGDFSAQMTLGGNYLNGGWGLTADPEEGYYWEMVATGANPNSYIYPQAQKALTPEQLDRVVKRAKAWTPATNNDPP